MQNVIDRFAAVATEGFLLMYDGRSSAGISAVITGFHSFALIPTAKMRSTAL
jgi:hypothetical protein